MAGNSQKRFHSHWFMGIVALAAVLWMGGHVQVFAQATTEDEATETLNELRMQFVPEPNIPMPEIYKSEPLIIEQTVGETSEWKLFYFCKYHTSDELKTLIHEQFATKLFDKKGKETQMPDYTVYTPDLYTTQAWYLLNHNIRDRRNYHISNQIWNR